MGRPIGRARHSVRADLQTPSPRAQRTALSTDQPAVGRWLQQILLLASDTDALQLDYDVERSVFELMLL